MATIHRDDIPFMDYVRAEQRSVLIGDTTLHSINVKAMAEALQLQATPVATILHADCATLTKISCLVEDYIGSEEVDDFLLQAYRAGLNGQFREAATHIKERTLHELEQQLTTNAFEVSRLSEILAIVGSADICSIVTGYMGSREIIRLGQGATP